jgi:solute carrier family 25 protein 34/35
MESSHPQAYSPALPVGAQHYYKSSFDALRTIVRAEGPRGLIRGIDAAILRTSMGSSVQLPSYNFTKSQIVKHGILPADSAWTFLLSSTVSGACVVRTHSQITVPANLSMLQCVAMQPADTALTRMYNQPTVVGPDGKIRGTLYKNPIDCLWKTFKIEGARGWYKGMFCNLISGNSSKNAFLGSTAHFMRIAPHT